MAYVITMLIIVTMISLVVSESPFWQRRRSAEFKYYKGFMTLEYFPLVPLQSFYCEVGIPVIYIP